MTSNTTTESRERTRQKNGAGTYKHHKLKDGTEYFEFQIYMGIGADGKPWRPSFYGDTEKLAHDNYLEWVKNSGNIPIEKIKFVGNYATEWLLVYKKKRCQENCL